MRSKVLLTTLTFFLYFLGLYAQPCPPYPTADGCGFADPACQNGLDGYCNTLMPQDQPTEDFPGCAGLAVLNNDDWIAFFAGTSTITIVITPSNCQTISGIQAGLYGACTDGAGPNGDGAAFHPLMVHCNSVTTPITLTYSSFIVGQTYYIVIDGGAGCICDYTIAVTQGSTLLLPPENPTGITGPTTICPDAIVTYTVPPVFSILNYVWSITGGTIISGPPSNTIQVQWNTSGTISVFGQNDCYTTSSVSLNVIVEIPPPGNDFGEYCEGSTYIYPGNGHPYTSGSYTIDFPGQGNLGCDSSVVLEVIEHPTLFTNLYRTICEGDQVMVGGVPYNTTGQWLITLQTSFGCDSTVFLDLTVLYPFAIVLQPPPIACSINQVTIDGTLSLGDTYEWSTFNGCINGGNTSPIITACAPGNYCLTVTSFGIDQGQPIECTDEMCVEVIEDTNTPVLFISNVEDESCGGANDGTATVEISSGGVPPFTTTWNSSPIQYGLTVTNLPCGQVCAIVTGSNNCSETICVTINCPISIVITTAGNDVLCNGEVSGSATASPIGGAGGYSYSWNTNPVQTNMTAVNLGAGVYTVVVTDANDCTESAMVEIFEPAAFDVSTSVTAATCNGESSGSASITVSGGAGVLSYTWNTNPVQTTSTATGLTAGDYTVIVTDANDCSVEETVTVTEPTAIGLSVTTTQTTCNNTPDGSATVSATGGTPGYMYSWNTSPVQNTATAINLVSGNYTVVVTDGNGCTATIMATVSSPNGMTVMTSSTNASCNGGADGIATVNTSGGTPGYTYTWDTNPVQTTPTVTGLTAGTYNVTIEDMNGCEEYESFVITEPTAVSLSSTTNDALCSGDGNGSATVAASGGTGAYTYSWNTIPEQTTATAVNLEAGSYTVVVMDANGCTENETVVINEPAVLSLATSGTDALCNQQADGTATVNPSGGTGPYMYQWSPGNQTGSTAINLLAGDYTVIVEDANGCTEQATVTIGEPSALALQLTGTDPACNQSLDGSATVTASGGTGSYTYQWNDPGNQTGQTASGLDGGTFTVVVTDVNGCTETESIIITSPTAIVLTTSQSNILCYGESTGGATVSPGGGTPPYTYSWNDLAGQNTATAVNLEAGSYTVTVTDANDCTEQVAVTLTEPAAALNATGTSTDALCGVNNGTIDLTVTGGTPPYSYDWSNDDITQDPQGLGPGTYTVVVTDANGCTFTTSVQVSTPSGLEALVSVTDVNCNGESNGQVDITVNGGVSPYTYIWSNGVTTQDLVDVVAGSYDLTLTDADGCEVVAGAIVEEPAALQATTTPSQASCGGSDGGVSLVVSGGSSPYVFDWDNDGTGDNDDSQSLGGIPQGIYTGVVTDSNGCSVSVNAEVTVPNGPVAVVNGENLECFEDNSGSIEVEITGGDAPYTYEWINDATYNGQEDLTGIYAGIWEVLITDDNNCSTTASIELTEPPPFEATNLVATGVSCHGDNDGNIILDVTGGTQPYAFLWDNTLQTVQNPENLPAGTYTVTATDANSCTATLTIVIEEPDEIQLTITTVSAACNGNSDGSIDLTVTGGLPPYFFYWNNGAYTEEDPSNILAGQYVVIVTDGNGCTQSTTTIVDQPQALQIIIDNISNYGGYNVSCWNTEDGTAQTIANGGTSPYSYAWSNGMETGVIEDIGPGLYTVTVTDVGGCTNTTQVSLIAPQPLDASVSALAVDCQGENSGQVIVESVVGGAMPYMYSIGESFSSVNQFTNLPAGLYEVTVRDANGCEYEDVVIIESPLLQNIFLEPEVEVQLGDDYRIEVVTNISDSEIDTIIWTPVEGLSCTDCLEPMVLSVLTETEYLVTIIDENGCSVSAGILLRVDKSRDIFIPNAFSPNGDGTNDVFMIFANAEKIKQVNTFRIFDRWGEMVFEANGFQPNDPDYGWDGIFNGEHLNPAVFVYFAEIEFIDGKTFIYKGDVTLMK